VTPDLSHRDISPVLLSAARDGSCSNRLRESGPERFRRADLEIDRGKPLAGLLTAFPNFEQYTAGRGNRH